MAVADLVVEQKILIAAVHAIEASVMEFVILQKKDLFVLIVINFLF
jgi:hypothetical protein